MRFINRLAIGSTIHRMTDNFWQGVAWLLPERLAYWAYVRVAAHYTVTHSDKIASEVTIFDPLKAW